MGARLTKKKSTEFNTSKGILSQRETSPPREREVAPIIPSVPNSPTSIVNFDTYLYQDGRKFHKDDISTYILPSDSIEIQRTDFTHDLYRHRWCGNYSSPVDERLSTEGGRVLDCGCGSGKWSYEMAVKYPNSTFVGLDMTPLFSGIDNSEIKPFNLAFLEHNICNGLPFQNKTFDFIFQRSMIISLSKSQWKTVLNEFARTIKPGGWLELMELQMGEINLTRTAKKFQRALSKYLERNHHYPYSDFPFIDLLKSTNKFDSIKLIQKKVAVGSWGGEFGLRVADVFVEGFKGMRPTMKKIMNVTDLEYDGLLLKLSKEIKNPLNDYMFITTVRVIAMKKK